MPMRVAFFLPHFGHGGAEGVVLRLLQGLDRRRFAPILALQRARGELLANVPADVPVLPLRNPRPPRCVAELARLFADQRVALSVTVTNATNLYALAAARLAGTGVRTFVTDHTPLSAFLADAPFPRLRRAAIRSLYPLASLSGGPLDRIGAEVSTMLGAAAPPFVALPNPVVERVGPLRRPSGNMRRVVSVGRLAAEKRFDLLIDAFAALVEALPAARLTIHGDGPERGRLEARISALGLSRRVRLAGYAADLDAVHGAADLFVCTSRREGLGNAMIEAMARGVPVLSVDCPFGPRRLLRDGAAGRLVEDDSPAAIARAMRDVLADEPLRARYVEAAFEVARGYQVAAAVSAYEAAFDRALGLEARQAA